MNTSIPPSLSSLPSLPAVEARIRRACERAGRDRGEVEIVAVTKTHGPDTVADAFSAGLRIIGENKVQEAAWKKPLSPSGPEWHLIGHLQSNKVRHALEIFDFIHSVDSARLAGKIESVAEETGASPRILLEVNVSGEKSKSGMPPGEVEKTIGFILSECPRISVEGLMTMAPFSENPEDARPHFRRLREIRDAAEKSLGVSLPRLSMGMSGDFETAIEEGATWIRLGTVLFGDRPKLKTVRATPDEPASGGLDSYSGAGPTVKILD